MLIQAFGLSYRPTSLSKQPGTVWLCSTHSVPRNVSPPRAFQLRSLEEFVVVWVPVFSLEVSVEPPASAEANGDENVRANAAFFSSFVVSLVTVMNDLEATVVCRRAPSVTEEEKMVPILMSKRVASWNESRRAHHIFCRTIQHQQAAPCKMPCNYQKALDQSYREGPLHGETISQLLLSTIFIQPHSNFLLSYRDDIDVHCTMHAWDQVLLFGPLV